MSLFIMTHRSTWKRCPEKRPPDSSDDFIPVPARFRTNAAPGTKEKIRVLTERVARGEELFRTDDRRL